MTSLWRWIDTDTKLSLTGDLAKSYDGRPYHISGRDELEQKMYILLSARKGAFIYDRELGSRIYEIDTESPDAVTETEAQARNALAVIPQAEVTGVQINNGAVTVFVNCGGEEFEIVPRINRESTGE